MNATSSTQHFLVNDPNYVLIQLKPGMPDPDCQCTSLDDDSRPRIKRAPQGNRLCWIEAFHMMRTMVGNDPAENLTEEWKTEQLVLGLNQQYEKKLTLNGALFRIANDDSLDGIDNSKSLQNSVNRLSRNSHPAVEVIFGNIFSGTDLKTKDDLNRAVIAHSIQRIVEIYQKFLAECDVDAEEMNNEFLLVTSLSNQRQFADFNPTQKMNFLSWCTFRTCYQKYQFEESTWNPSSNIEALVSELRTHGPLLVSGSFGQAFYSTPAFKLRNLVGGRSIWAWTPQIVDVYFKARPLGKETHYVVIVGAEAAENRSYVYFVDPIDGSSPDEPEKQKIYKTTLDRVRQKISNFWGEILFDDNRKPIFVSHIGYALRSK